MASVLHIRVTLRALKGATKEGNGFRQANGTPESWGQGVHIPPPPLSSCAAAPGNRLRFPQRRTHNLLPHTHQHTRGKQALSCTKVYKDTHKDEHTFRSMHTQTSTHTHTHSHLSQIHTPYFSPLLKVRSSKQHLLSGVCLDWALLLLAAEFRLIIRRIFALSFLISQEFQEPSRELLYYPSLALDPNLYT